MRNAKLGPLMFFGIMVMLVLPAGSMLGATGADGPGSGTRIMPDDLFGNTRTAFVENAGQWAPGIRFMALTDFGSVALTDAGISLDVRTVDREKGTVEGSVIDLLFDDANPVGPVGDDMVSTRYNFFTGKDASSWRTDLSGYGTVTYRNLWDGIDLVYRTGPSGTKYDLIVAPGADPSDISFRVSGAEGLKTSGGSLVISTGIGIDLSDSGLVAFDEERSPVEAWFRIDGDSYGFSLGKYDRTKEMIIDPIMGALVFSTYVGGSSDEDSSDMEMDADEDIYVCGQTGSFDFPAVKGHYQDFLNNWSDGFVFKMDSSGSSLIWATYIGGSQYDRAASLKVDENEDVYLLGYTESNDFPVTKGAYNTSLNNASGDLFVSKLDSRATMLYFSTYIGGPEWEELNWDQNSNIDVDESGNVYAVGMTHSRSFPITDDAFQDSINPPITEWEWEHYPSDLVLFEISADGSDLIYSTFLGGTSDEYAYALEYAGRGVVYVGGYTYSTDFNVTAKAFSTSMNGWMDSFLFAFDLSSGSLPYSTFLGGMDSEEILDIEIGPEGDIYACGGTYSTDFPVSRNAFQPANTGNRDGFIISMDSTLSTVLMGTYVGGSSWDYFYDLNVEDSGEVHAVGYTESDSDTSDFPVLPGSFQDTISISPWGWSSDATYVKMSSDLSEMLYGTFIGGTDGENLKNVIVAPSDARPVISGDTYSTDFPVKEDAYQTALNGWSDVVVLKLDLALPPKAPMDLIAIAGDEFVNISWSPPLDDGGAEIEEYIIYRTFDREDTIEYNNTDPSTLFFNDTAVRNGVTYTYWIQARNRIGRGPLSDPASAMPTSVPSMPENFTADYGSHQVKLTWDPPSDRGGLLLIGYRLYRAEADGEFVAYEFPVNKWEHTDLEAENGVVYSYYMVAYNLDGESEPTETLSVIPRDRPDPPLDLVVDAGPGFVFLSWQPPEFDQGADIVNYTVYIAPEGRVPYPYVMLPADVLNFTDTGVENGKEYRYYVTATNSEGESLPSDIAFGVPLDIPGEPIDVELYPGEGRITVRWDPPREDGGSPITGYVVYRFLREDIWEKVHTAGAEEDEYTDTTVTNGRNYVYVVTARNLMGESEFSLPANATPKGRPSAVRDLAIVPGDGMNGISWTAPELTGGTPITAYWVLKGTSPDDLRFLEELPASVLGTNDTDLENGVVYYYTVRPINAIGMGPLVQPVSGMPVGLPLFPDNIRVVPGDSKVTISWNAPLSSGGSDVTTVTIYRWTAGDPLPVFTTSMTDGSFEDTEVENGILYNYSLSATNSLGEGQVSEVFGVVPSGLPSAPGGITVTVKDGVVHITWSTPASNGGRPLTGYLVYRTDPAGKRVLLGQVGPSQTSFDDEGAGAGKKYSYSVSALNGNGESPMANPVSVTLSKETASSPVPLAIAVILFLLLLAAIVVIFLMARKMRQTTQVPPPMGYPPMGEGQMDTMGYSQPGLDTPIIGGESMPPEGFPPEDPGQEMAQPPMQ